MKPSISLAMIARNEERCLARCLASARDWVEEIVLVDTGSSDSTIAIAKDHGASVTEIPWPEAFDIARNVSLGLVKTDWVLWLDADEWFEDDNASLLLANFDQGKEAVLCERREWNQGKEEGRAELVRLWKHRPERRFVGVVHESISDFNLEMEAAKLIAKSPSIIEHDGYSGPLHKEKIQRNLEMLQREIEIRPGQIRYEIYLAESLIDLSDPKGSALMLDLATRVAYTEEDFSRESKVLGLINKTLHEMTAEQAQQELAERLLFRIATWFPDSPPLRWAAAKVEAQRRNWNACLSHLIAIEKMSNTGNFNRWLGFDPDIFGALLWPRMMKVAETLKREDIVSKCKDKMTAE